MACRASIIFLGQSVPSIVSLGQNRTLFLPVNARIRRSTERQASVPEFTNRTFSKHGTLSMTTLASLFCSAHAQLQMQQQIWAHLLFQQEVMLWTYSHECLLDTQAVAFVTMSH